MCMYVCMYDFSNFYIDVIYIYIYIVAYNIPLNVILHSHSWRKVSHSTDHDIYLTKNKNKNLIVRCGKIWHGLDMIRKHCT